MPGIGYPSQEREYIETFAEQLVYFLHDNCGFG